MFEALTAVQRRDVYRNGTWIVPSFAIFNRLDPNFQIPMEPFWVEVPRQHQEQLEQHSATFRDPNRPVIEKLTDSQRRAKRLRTTG